jgi:hypothetical protein
LEIEVFDLLSFRGVQIIGERLRNKQQHYFYHAQELLYSEVWSTIYRQDAVEEYHTKFHQSS